MLPMEGFVLLRMLAPSTARVHNSTALRRLTSVESGTAFAYSAIIVQIGPGDTGNTLEY
jgi:hypothetical protein